VSGRHRLVVGLLVALLVCAAGLASSHGHLDASHPRSCAACTLASSHAQIAAPPSLPPIAIVSIDLPRPTVAAAPPPSRPPLETAPKNGPPRLA